LLEGGLKLERKEHGVGRGGGEWARGRVQGGDVGRRRHSTTDLKLKAQNSFASIRHLKHVGR